MSGYRAPCSSAKNEGVPVPTASPLASAYAKLAWAESRHDQMGRTFEQFVRTSDDATPYGIQFESKANPPGLVIARFIKEREMPEAISLLASDLIHNSRVALDHTLARLKETFGGHVGQGSFPVITTQSEWDRRIDPAKGHKNPLHKLDEAAVDRIYRQQPLHQADPDHDPLVIAHRLDNADKHRLLYEAFVYPRAAKGTDLVDVTDTTRLVNTRNAWNEGDVLEHDTVLARFLFSRLPPTERPPLRANNDMPLVFAIGVVGEPRVEFEAIIARVREVVDDAARLIEGS
jgi:hypothetical protein